MPPHEYSYPDPGDRVTRSFIERHEPFPGYWAASEGRALELLGERLTAPRARTRALDAGCGDGRLLPWLARYAAHVTAADPDPDRLAHARATSLPADTEIAFRTASMAEVQGGPYDLVLCSHIVQHMPTGAIEPALRHLHEITAPDALLVMSYSRAPVGGGGYVLEWRENGEIRYESVDRHRFDEALTTGARTGVLPVRLLDPEEFGKEVAATGWSPVWEWTYHVLDDFGVLDSYADRDDLVNGHPALRHHLGRDIFTLWRRDGRRA
ncbi:class I SAM-dependent methyltransferase [Amycolatopsis sp. K13G38]|uniref:Class I SAM-dependent methyltransferase n=1 Tax=Amycolatopsis acididurans TaxID=2724524 RepID=A0ABX1IVD7_9PSEU|nr:class I SAM-dependent methyltransferase [Amycolatopsis acididurans]NKQ51269.1 class I SAM-dependent methyltransferase [Amycolatopsis acididurans]